MTLKYFNKAFKGYLKKHTKTYKKMFLTFLGETICLSFYKDKKKNELYIFYYKITNLKPWSVWFYPSLYYLNNYFFHQHYLEISNFIDKNTKIFSMGTCFETIFFNTLFGQYHKIFPIKKNIYFISLVPPLVISSKKYMLQMKKMGVNILVFKVKTDNITTKKFDTELKDHIVILDEIYKPHPKNPSFNYRLLRFLFGNHDLLHHLHAIKRYFKKFKNWP